MNTWRLGYFLCFSNPSSDLFNVRYWSSNFTTFLHAQELGVEMLRIAILQITTAVYASFFKYIGHIFSKICQPGSGQKGNVVVE